MAKSKNQAPSESAPDDVSLGEEKICTKCRLSKPMFDFGQNRQTADGKHYHCKACRSLYAQTPDARRKHREAYTARTEKQKIAHLEAQLNIIREKTGEPMQRGKYCYDSPLAVIKGSASWQEMAADLEVSRDTLLKWQRDGAPVRFQRAAFHTLKALRLHYEQLVVSEDSLNAEWFFAICKRDGWKL